MGALYLPLFHLISVSLAPRKRRGERRREEREKRTHWDRQRLLVNYYLLFIIYSSSTIIRSDRTRHIRSENRVHEEKKRKLKKRKNSASELCSSDSRSERKWQITNDQDDAHVSGFFFFFFFFCSAVLVVVLVLIFVLVFVLDEFSFYWYVCSASHCRLTNIEFNSEDTRPSPCLVALDYHLNSEIRKRPMISRSMNRWRKKIFRWAKWVETLATTRDWNNSC